MSFKWTCKFTLLEVTNVLMAATWAPKRRAGMWHDSFLLALLDVKTQAKSREKEWNRYADGHAVSPASAFRDSS